jgi:phospholipase/carboxylesterase
MIQYSAQAIGNEGIPTEPTVFMFHGWGANMYDIQGISSYFPTEWNWRFIQGPIHLGQQSFGWFPKDLSIFQTLDPLSYFLDLPDSFQDEIIHIEQYLREQLELLPSTKGTTIIGGFSQGAMVSLACLFEMKVFDSINGVIAFSPTSWGSLEEKIPTIQKINRIPILISHGYQDPILPFHKTEKLVQLLQAHLTQVQFFPFQGQHEIPDNVLRSFSQALKELKVH